MKRVWLVLAVLALTVVVAMALPAVAQVPEESDYQGKGVYGTEEEDSSGDTPGEPQCGWYSASAGSDEWWEYWCWWPGWGWEYVFWVWA